MIAYTYPGQGSQQPGMGEAWVDHPSWELVAEASDAADRDVAHLLLHADAEELRETRNSQIATFVTSMVVLDAVSRVGVEAAAHAGHSLGEYSALAASGALGLGDAVRLVAERGEAMQVASEEREGTMAAVLGLDDDDVEIACARHGDDVWIANYNAPGQVVIAGTPDATAATGEIAKELGAKRVMPLAVGGAFHTPLMAAARDRLRKALDQVELRAPDHPVYANVDGRAHVDADAWPALLNSQLTKPVRWRQTLHAMAGDGITTFIELGPGTVLTGMTKRTVKGSRTVKVNTPADVDTLLETLAGPPAGHVGHHEGEHLFATERLVVSPCAGVFRPDGHHPPGTQLTAGQLLGHVNDNEVRSPWGGELMGFLAVAEERVTGSQPIAWMRIP